MVLSSFVPGAFKGVDGRPDSEIPRRTKVFARISLSLYHNAAPPRQFFVPPAHGQYQQTPLPLAAIYILMPRDPMRKKVDIEGLGPAGGLNALMNQRFCNAPITPTYPAETFAALSDLAQQVPVRHVYRPHGLETLPELVTAVLADIGHYDV